MKTKFGLAVGLNVAVACLVMQGCKAPRVTNNNYGNDVRTVEPAPVAVVPADDIKVSNTPPPAPTVAPSPAPVAVETAPAVVPAPSAKPDAKPSPSVEPAPSAEAGYTLYKVKPGDMLSKISKRYNIRQKAILDMNPGLSPNKLYAGRMIKLPGKMDGAVDAAVPVEVAPAPAAAASVEAPKAPKSSKYAGATRTYVVKSGDSLSKIAHENGTNVRTLKELNGLKNDRVFVGRKLKVPAGKADAKPAAPAGKPDVKAPAPAKKSEAKNPDVSAKKDDVNKPGATAKKEDAKKEAAGKGKKAEDAAAPVAEPAVAPAAEATAAKAAPVAESAAPAVTLDTHTVKEGEDVVSIAISYGVSPSALMDANDLKSSEVKPGDVLKIPAKNAQ